MNSGFVDEALEGFGENPDVSRAAIPTGYEGIDDAIGGFEAGKLYLIGGRPAMGKSTLAYNLMLNMGLKHNVISVLFSLETSARVVIRMLVSIMAKIDYGKARSGYLDSEEIERIKLCKEMLKKTGMIINDHYYADWWEFIDEFRLICQKERARVVFVDYLQLLSNVRAGSTSIVEIGEEIRLLKRIAREEGVAVIILSQLSRRLESREDKRPKINDFLISEEAMDEFDCIIGLYRDDYYDCESVMDGNMEVEILRREPCFSTVLGFDREYLRFYDFYEWGEQS
ncbi:MAG: Replicative DNA helicase [Bacteroides rodentium]